VRWPGVIWAERSSPRPLGPVTDRGTLEAARNTWQDASCPPFGATRDHRRPSARVRRSPFSLATPLPQLRLDRLGLGKLVALDELVAPKLPAEIQARGECARLRAASAALTGAAEPVPRPATRRRMPSVQSGNRSTQFSSRRSRLTISASSRRTGMTKVSDSGTWRSRSSASRSSACT
jgi:hypothetical protein